MSADATKKSPGVKIQGYVPAYHKYVISSLIGIEGTNESDVVARIIGYWSRENEGWLVGRGISYESFRRRGDSADEKEGKLFRYPPGQDRG